MNGIITGIYVGISVSILTYLLTRMGEISTKIYERKKKNLNALMRFEYLCCENMNTINDTIFVIDDFIEAAEIPLKNNKPIVYGNALFSIPFNDDLILDLTNLDFLNDLLGYKIDITRINHDIDTTNKMYEAFKLALINKDIDFAIYKSNALLTIEKCKKLKPFLEQLKETTIVIKSYSCLLRKKNKPLLSRIIHLFCINKSSKDSFREELEEEILKNKKAQQAVSQKSREELEEMKKKIKTEIDS